MKKISLFLFVFCVGSLFAQDWSTDKYQYGELYKGYVVTNEGEKIEGYVKYQNRTDMQEEIIFYKTKAGSKEKYEASDLLEYMVADKLYHCIRYSGNSAHNKQANLVVDDQGCLREYVWYERAPGYNALIQREGETDEEFSERKYPSKTVYHKKGDDLAVDKEYFKADFGKNVSSYLSENKELSKKIKKGESGYTKMFELEKIFKEYNDNCGK